jgi:hypothetical protein
MTTCPYCQRALEGVGSNSTRASDEPEPARYVLCPDCHNLVAGSSTH